MPAAWYNKTVGYTRQKHQITAYVKVGTKMKHSKNIYEIMHGEQAAARIDTQGHCRIFDEGKFLPYNLYLDDTDEELDTLVNNLTNFQYWCAGRILPPDRQYAKEILNSIGVSQAVTDRDRAQIALSCRCLSLTDIYWVRRQGEKTAFQEVNLYDNHLDNAFIDVSLRGRQITVHNDSLIPDLSTNGCFPKAWLRHDQGFTLLKDGGIRAVENELLASKVCQCFRCPQVVYRETFYDGVKVSAGELMTSRQYSIVSREAFEIYAVNQGIDPAAYILELDSHSYYMMNILDYLVGNTDRHWGNWGFLVDNETNQPVSLHPLMDFNQAFQSYDQTDGANCLSVLPKHLTQREAAIQAVSKIGLNQIGEIDPSWFKGRATDYQMLTRRLEILRAIEKASDTL